MMKTRSFVLAIFGLVRSTTSLHCYFCKSDYESGVVEEEQQTKDIPYCNEEPYEGFKEHVVTCEIYYDNFAMTNPSFREALSSTTHSHYRGRNHKNDHRFQSSDSQQGNEHPNITNGTFSTRDNSSAHGKKSHSLKDVYPYNLTDTPWGTQRIHDKVSPYHCLTIHTINSTFPNRVCGLRYFLDCAVLIELTSEPLEPSSFISSCHECITDYCNGSSDSKNRVASVPHSSIIFYVLIVVFEL